MRLLIGFLLGATVVAAQSPPRLNSASLEWVQRGATTSLSLSGEFLDQLTAVLIDGDPGVRASLEPVATAVGGIESSAGGVSPVSESNSKSLKLSISSDTTAPLTARELRVVTKSGVSNPLPLRLSDLPEISSREDNKTLPTAQAIALPATVSGVISGNSETDHFKFEAQPNQPLVFEVIGFRLPGSQLDSSLTILDTTGKELARNEDTIGLDSVLVFTAPAPGSYILALRDFRHLGGGDFRYRLRAGALPFVSSYFPLGGQRGEQVQLDFVGANLEGTVATKIQLAPNAPAGVQELRASHPRGLSNPFLFDISPEPNFLEREPNSSIDQADAVSFPGVINGRINGDKDWDAFKFQAEKGRQLTFELHAYKFGSPLDALLTLTDSRGVHLARNDDSAASDSRIDFTFPETGEYHLLVEDLLGRGGDSFTYRLTGRSQQPSVSVVFLPDTPRLAKGGRVPIRFEFSAVNGFNDSVRIEPENLPTGVFAEPLVLSPAQPSGLMVLTARDDAFSGTVPLRFRAVSLNSAGISQAPIPLSGDRPAKSGYLTLLDPAPFTIAFTSLSTALEQNQSAQVQFVVHRRDKWQGDISVVAEGFSAGRDPITKSFDAPAITLKASETTGVLSLKAKQDAEIGTRPILLKAEADFNGAKTRAYSALLPVTTSEIPFVLSASLKKLAVTALPEGTSSAAAEGFFTIKVARRAGFNGAIDLKVEGVPEGIKLESAKIPAGGGEAIIKLIASEKAPGGKEFELKVTGHGVHNDRNYRFQAPAITLAVNAPEQSDTKLAENAK